MLKHIPFLLYKKKLHVDQFSTDSESVIANTSKICLNLPHALMKFDVIQKALKKRRLASNALLCKKQQQTSY